KAEGPEADGAHAPQVPAGERAEELGGPAHAEEGGHGRGPITAAPEHVDEHPPRGPGGAGTGSGRGLEHGAQVGGGRRFVLHLVGDHGVDEGGGVVVDDGAQPPKQVVGDALAQIAEHRFGDLVPRRTAVVAVEGSSVRAHGALRVSAQCFEAGDEALVVAQLLGRHLAETAARRLVGGSLGLRLRSLVRLQLAVGHGAEDLDQGGVHRFFSFRGRSPSSSRVTTKSATTEAGTPSSVARRRRASWLMRAATEKATIRAGASTTWPWA